MAKKKEGQRLSIYLTSEALKIYDSWPRHERSKMVSEAIIEKHSKTKEIFTEEQMDFISNKILTMLQSADDGIKIYIKRELNKLQEGLEERIKKLERMMEK